MAGRSRGSRSHISMIQESWEFSLSWHRSEITEIMAGRIRTAPLVPIAAGVEAAIIWALRGWIISGNWPGWSELAMSRRRNPVHHHGDHGGYSKPAAGVRCDMAKLADHTGLAWRSLRGPASAPPRPHAHVRPRRPPHSRPRLTDPHTSLPMGRRARSHPRTEALRARCGAVL